MTGMCESSLWYPDLRETKFPKTGTLREMNFPKLGPLERQISIFLLKNFEIATHRGTFFILLIFFSGVDSSDQIEREESSETFEHPNDCC